MTVLVIFYYGHIDDPPPRIIIGRIICDILHPPWVPPCRKVMEIRQI